MQITSGQKQIADILKIKTLFIHLYTNHIKQMVIFYFIIAAIVLKIVWNVDEFRRGQPNGKHISVLKIVYLLKCSRILELQFLYAPCQISLSPPQATWFETVHPRNSTPQINMFVWVLIPKFDNHLLTI